MPRPKCLPLFWALCLFASTPGAEAGAFMLQEGQGQFIVGVGYVESSRRFNQEGQVEAAPSFRKAVASGYLEYGLIPTVSLIVAPALTREHDSPTTNTVIGSDASAFGARYQLFGAADGVVAVQALLQPPIGGVRNSGADVRLMFGRSFPLFGWSAFVDLEPGVRVRTDAYPTEARFDLAFGVRPVPWVLLLVQDFASYAPATGVFERSAYSKLQASVVYDVSRTWSVQVGMVRTVAGRAIVRETGPIAAIWYRF